MANVFLSYDHEDAARAAPMTSALEQSGHSVWWDRHIHGGAEYNSEIEGAVERADIVVVLWSERSVRSAWVRDEAAEGRDNGKLVPVSLDGTKPPMGFRQYQTIDLSHWKGRKPPAKMPEILHAIDIIVGPSPTGKLAATRAASQPPRQNIFVGWAASSAAVIAIIVIGLLIWRPWTSEPSAVVAIFPADSSRGSQEYARDLLAQLGQLQSAKPHTLQLVGAQARKRASLVFEVAGVNEGRQARANLVLLDGRTGGLLWSKAFERPANDTGDLRQQLGYTGAQVLECAVEAHLGGRAALKPEPLKLYLSGCADLVDADHGDVLDLVPLFRRVIAAAPKFEGARAKLLSAEYQAYSSGVASVASDLKRDIAAARKINPEMAEAYLAEVSLMPYHAWAQKLSLVDRATASAPDSSEPVTFRSESLFAVGRVSDALDDARRAVELNPISPRARQYYIFALAQSGRTKGALEEIVKAERIWPGSSAIAEARFAINLRFGDPQVARQMIESGQVDAGWNVAQNFLKARLSHKSEDIEGALRDARAAYQRDHNVFQHLVQTLSIFDREDQLLDLLLRVPLEDAIYVTDVTFRPASRELWRDARSFGYANRVGLLQYWRSSGKWPDFCFASDLPYDCKVEASKYGT